MCRLCEGQAGRINLICAQPLRTQPIDLRQKLPRLAQQFLHGLPHKDSRLAVIAVLEGVPVAHRRAGAAGASVIRRRILPHTAGARQDVPARVWAPQRRLSRTRRCSGCGSFLARPGRLLHRPNDYLTALVDGDVLDDDLLLAPGVR